MKVLRSIVIDAPVETVWAVVRHFDSVKNWHPAVAICHMEDGRSRTEVGGVRHVALTDGGIFRETLLALDDRQRAIVYNIVESPLPVWNFIAELSLRPITDDGTTLATWTAEFETDPENLTKMEDAVGERIVMTGLHGLRQHFPA